MRVKGNVSPNVLDIEAYSPMSGYVEVRLRENIKAVPVVDEMTETEITMYEYDEYTFHLREEESLQEEIETNMSDWLATGRAMEVGAGVSIVAEYEAALTEIENALGVTS